MAEKHCPLCGEGYGYELTYEWAAWEALNAERDRLRKYLTEARPIIEAHNPSLHAEIMADPMWQPVDA